MSDIIQEDEIPIVDDWVEEDLDILDEDIPEEFIEFDKDELEIETD